MPTKFEVLTNQNTTKKMGHKRIMIFASIGVLPLIIISTINTHIHHLLLGKWGVFFGVRLFLVWSTLRSYHCCVRGISMGIGVDSWGWIAGGSKIFLFSMTSRPVLGLTQPPIQWVPGLFHGDENLSKLRLSLYNAIINFSSSLISYRIPSNARHIC
jgi:hypothetical protein